ncbi:MAG: ATP-binding cassette domain-containing protein [Bacteroidales bacterium]|nr:ATP-binding cassette domain-containing protein [Bacteroidales bacterium]
MSIDVQHITKHFGRQPALSDVSFSVKTGEIAGFIGPNGAGKSTTMKIICGLLAPDQGTVSINNHRIDQDDAGVRHSLGYLPETNPLYPEMYIVEYLSYVAGMYGLGKKSTGKINDIIELTGLSAEKDKTIGSLSKGYRQRVGLAQALLHNPSVLILDEPTSGLDPNQIIEIRNLIKFIGTNKTILLSTHIMQEVEAICDRVIIINKGKIVADSITRHLKNKNDETFMTIFVEFNDEPPRQKIKQIPGVEKVQQVKEKTWLIQCDMNTDIRPAIFSFAVENNLIVLSMHRQEKKLEDVFRELTN